jgi:SH3-like domain-containing protein
LLKNGLNALDVVVVVSDISGSVVIDWPLREVLRCSYDFSRSTQAFSLSACIFLKQEEEPARPVHASMKLGVKRRIRHFNQDFCPASTEGTCCWLITPDIDIVIIHAAKLLQRRACVNGL